MYYRLLYCKAITFTANKVLPGCPSMFKKRTS